MKAIIFDLDGTLVDTPKLHIKAHAKVLSRYGIKLTKKLYKKYHEKDTRSAKIIKNILKDFHVKADSKRLAKEKQKIYREIVKKEAKTLPATINLLKKLRKRYKLALVSSNPRKNLNVMLEKFNLRKFFDVVICEDDVSRPKPNPQMHLKAARRLGVKPKNCLVFEDSKAGVEAAKLANMRVIGVTTGLFSKKELKNADVVIKSMKQASFNILGIFVDCRAKSY